MPHALLSCPFGQIRVAWDDETLTMIDLDPTDREPASLPSLPSRSVADDPAGCAPVLPAAISGQLQDYFDDARATFDVPLALEGTAFQQRVWAALRAIPSGQTRTYGDLARELGTAARAIGQACRANPCPIVVPCHRVVGVQGLGGFAGDTSGRLMCVKRWLLSHEGWLPAGN
jgi:methylated-DNA-[protein]-cysteine S-methyltransferase